MSQPNSFGSNIADSPAVVRESQNKVGACATNGCIGGIVVVACILGSSLLVMGIVLVVRWRRRRRARVQDVELQRNTAAGRPDREEFALANPPSARDIRRLRIAARLKLTEPEPTEYKTPDRDSLELSPKSIVPKPQRISNPVIMQSMDKNIGSLYLGDPRTTPVPPRRDAVIDAEDPELRRDSVATRWIDIESGKPEMKKELPKIERPVAPPRSNTDDSRHHAPPSNESRDQVPLRRSNTDSGKRYSQTPRNSRLSAQLAALNDEDSNSRSGHTYSQPRLLGPYDQYFRPSTTEQPESQNAAQSPQASTPIKKSKLKRNTKEKTLSVDELNGRQIPESELDGKPF